MKLIDAVFVIGLGIIGSYLSGCSGVELGGKLGLYEVTQRDEQVSSKTRQIPFRCRFVNCNQEDFNYGK